MKAKTIAQTAVALALALTGACSVSQPVPPGVTFDGLEQVPNTRGALVYRKPGVDISGYTAVTIAPCDVAFRKNWEQSQNQSRVDLSSRITKKDVERIKAALGEMCVDAFRKALLEPPPYNVVDSADVDGDVLELDPSIINLDINAPDKLAPGRTRSYTTTAGEMTLYLELRDGTTGEVLARVVDRQRDIDTYRLQWTNSVTNRAAAQRILKNWAQRLREGLDRARAKP